ncbi:glycosyltransferase [Desulfomicrobium baculatum]|uniref:Glycosyl transferase group 1 n=1 Tax=Desulfomicrobium baculatum (strain DSM 4028 / VKM B-1378 / X) TaxID=525897 RepID=C7LS79_DESBD|nr:glycosyltransferase [Desulfomicrobium baculatum]ACU90627.1 glycosyl transferase group 1 [Desulfomicrobium baculatum DSM 4028]
MSMNIIYTIGSIDFASGGPSRVVTSLVQEIAKLGCNVSLVTLGNMLSNVEEDFNIKMYRHDSSVISKFKAILRMRKYILTLVNANHDRSIIHDQGIWLPTNHSVVGISKKMNIPLVVSPHGMLSPWALRHKALKKKIAWLLYQSNDLKSVNLFHATSYQEAKNIFECGFRKPVAVIPNGVEIPAMGKKIFNKKSKKSILFLSRIYPVKGLLNLVSAWSKIRNPDWKIVVAGPDEANHLQDVLKAINLANLDESFDFIGPVDDFEKWKLYFDSDLFVLPSYSENFGIVIAEALACGLPVITTTATPWKELETYNCGWWIGVGVDPLVESLLEAISISDTKRQSMGSIGRQLVENKYSWPMISENMISVYEWVLGGGSPPSCVMTD